VGKLNKPEMALSRGKMRRTTFIAIMLCGILAYGISVAYPPLDALFLSLIFGVFSNTFFDGDYKEDAEKFLSIMLPIGIAMYGANIKLNAELPSNFVAMAVVSAIMLGTLVYFFSKYVFSLNNRLSFLLSCGTAICGASAIAIVASLTKPKKEEFSSAVIVITIVGLTGAVILPYLYNVFHPSLEKYALLCGATLHQTGLVEIATKPFGVEAVRSALEVKSVRIALIAVVAFFTSISYSEHRYYVPWYIAAFLVLSYFSSYLPSGILSVLKPASTIAFSITLAAVGFSVNIKDIQNMRLDPLVAAYAGWICAFIVVFAVVIL
jgi:uncharacterized integral membrane protein (TIGR00698 family)